jgi:hypothetical protein
VAVLLGGARRLKRAVTGVTTIDRRLPHRAIQTEIGTVEIHRAKRRDRGNGSTEA